MITVVDRLSFGHIFRRPEYRPGPIVAHAESDEEKNESGQFHEPDAIVFQPMSAVATAEISIIVSVIVILQTGFLPSAA